MTFLIGKPDHVNPSLKRKLWLQPTTSAQPVLVQVTLLWSQWTGHSSQTCRELTKSCLPSPFSMFSTNPSMWASLEINSFFLYFTQETCTGLSFKLLMLTTSYAYKDSKLILVLKRCLSVFKATHSLPGPETLAFSYPQLLPFIPAALPTLFIWDKLCFFLQHHVNTDTAPTWFIFFMPW